MPGKDYPPILISRKSAKDALTLNRITKIHIYVLFAPSDTMYLLSMRTPLSTSMTWYRIT